MEHLYTGNPTPSLLVLGPLKQVESYFHLHSGINLIPALEVHPTPKIPTSIKNLDTGFYKYPLICKPVQTVFLLAIFPMPWAGMVKTSHPTSLTTWTKHII